MMVFLLYLVVSDAFDAVAAAESDIVYHGYWMVSSGCCCWGDLRMYSISWCCGMILVWCCMDAGILWFLSQWQIAFEMRPDPSDIICSLGLPFACYSLLSGFISASWRSGPTGHPNALPFRPPILLPPHSLLTDLVCLGTILCITIFCITI